jgi:DNA-binding transcriptional LysR family regulator
MWQPDLINAIAEGTVDVAITCGLLSEPPGVIGEVFCAETFMVALRTTHRFATRDSVSFADLAHDRLGFPNESLFPAWASAQRQALTNTAIAPPTVELDPSDLGAIGWTKQPAVDWILTTAALAEPSANTVALSVSPAELLHYKLQWNPDRAKTAAIARFVHLALSVDVPPGWMTQPGHLRHDQPSSVEPGHRTGRMENP